MNNKAKKSQSGIVLLEVMVAILIFSIGVIAAVGLQAKMLKHATNVNFRAAASAIAHERLGRVWVDQQNMFFYQEEDTDISNLEPYRLPNGKRSTVMGDLGAILIVVTWQAPGDTEVSRYALDTIVYGGE